MTPSDNTDPKLEELINKSFEDYLLAEIGLVGEFSTNIKSDEARMRAKVKHEKTAILKAIQADRESASMVNHTSSYEPITVVDQFGNKYVCLNYYEAMQLEHMLISMQGRGITDYDTGDWWRDLPVKLTKWLAQLTKGSDE